MDTEVRAVVLRGFAEDFIFKESLERQQNTVQSNLYHPHTLLYHTPSHACERLGGFEFDSSCL
eukprot:3549023-Rhodomonas_salina.1